MVVYWGIRLPGKLYIFHIGKFLALWSTNLLHKDKSDHQLLHRTDSECLQTSKPALGFKPNNFVNEELRPLLAQMLKKHRPIFFFGEHKEIGRKNYNSALFKYIQHHRYLCLNISSKIDIYRSVLRTVSFVRSFYEYFEMFI